MELDLVLNELSIRTPADNFSIARLRMSSLIRTIRSAIAKGGNRALRTHQDFNDLFLAIDYPVRLWRNDKHVDREEQRFLRSLTTKAPYLTDLPEVEQRTLECHFTGELANGLRVAWLIEGLAVSIPSEPTWEQPFINVNLTELDEIGEWVEEIVEVHHACYPEHIERHTTWFTQRIALIRQQQHLAVRSGADIWNKRAELYPNLLFCESVNKQLLNVPSGAELIQPIIKRLLELDSFSKNWADGPFDSSLLPCKVTPESPQTLDNPKLAEKRTILCPDGIVRLFSWHVRLTPGAWRIHFFPDNDKKQIIIGQIGDLPTMLYKT